MTALTKEALEQTAKLMAQHQRPDGGYNFSAMAMELKLSRSTVADRVKRIRKGIYGNFEPIVVPLRYTEQDEKTEQDVRVETRSFEFWRKRAKELEAQLSETENVLRHVSGLVGRPLLPPPFIMPAKSSKQNRVAGLLHISDIHAGEEVVADAISGINSYDLDVCKRRLGRLFHATLEALPRWSADSELTGIVVALNGDLVSGSIHDELAESDLLVAQQQAWFVADELASGLQALIDKFGTVFVVVTPGNHGRQTKKPRHKRIAAASYDTAVGEMLRRHFAGDPRISFYIAPSRDAIYPVLGWTVWQSHGDQTLRGGSGFAGPMLPIVRGTKMVEWQAAQLKREFDILLTAHMHTSGNPGKVLANGSVIGASEYSHGLRSGVEVPKQWLALIHEKWCLRERVDVQLEDPHKPEKPRIRVPQKMA